MKYLNKKIMVGDLGKIYIPSQIQKKLKIAEGDILELTATENLIIIEKFEGGINEI